MSKPKPETALIPAVATNPVSSDVLLRPAVSPEAAKVAWKEYLELCQAILDEGDYIYFVTFINRQGQGDSSDGFLRLDWAERHAELCKRQGCKDIEIRPRKKRSAWDKLARFFNLTVPKREGDVATISVEQVGPYIVERRIGTGFTLLVYQKIETLEIVKAVTTVAVQAPLPSGRVVIGEAVCSVSERKQGAKSFAHADHDVVATSFTRAWNRAVSRCIGTGEVSAEEMGEEREPEPNKEEQVAATATTTPAPETLSTSAATSGLANSQPSVSKEATLPATQIQPEVARKNLAPFKPAQGKFAERLEAIEKYLFGPETDMLVRYFFFVLDPQKPADIETNGSWHAGKWHDAMKALADRVKRLEKIEEQLKAVTEASEEGKVGFIGYMKEMVKARAEVFAKK